VAPAARSQGRRLSIVLGLNLAMITGLLIVGVFAHSLGVLAAGADYVADSAALLLGLLAVAVHERSGGRSRAPVYAALTNAVVLSGATMLVVVASVRRLAGRTPVVHGLPVVVVSSVATIVMVLGAVVLGRAAGRENLHMRSVLLDTLGDALSAAAVAVTGAIIYATGGWFWLDPVVALLVSAVIAVGTARLLRDVATALTTRNE
jgi:cobalt-zinc-cadmium efflux system protein